MSSLVNPSALEEHMILIIGEAGEGKSSCLLNIPDQPGVAYFSFEGPKDLPYSHEFKFIKVAQISDFFRLLDLALASPQIHTIVLDTISAMMSMYESQMVLLAANKMTAWSDYAQFWKTLIYDKLTQTKKPCLCLGHIKTITLPSGEVSKTVPVKGQLGEAGLEMYFTIITRALKVPISKFAELNDDGTVKYSTPLLTVSPREEAMRVKYVLQTLPTAEDPASKIRSLQNASKFMWDIPETYINSDITLYLDRLRNFKI